MQTHHTPGPWTFTVADTINDEPAYWHITDQHCGVVGDVQSVNLSDARLIAAAPDLLAALQSALDQLSALSFADDRIVYARERARAAIARATGQ